MKKHEVESGESCPDCGDELLVITSCPEEGQWYDGDTAFCPECNAIVGTMSVDEDGSSWFQELWP